MVHVLINFIRSKRKTQSTVQTKRQDLQIQINKNIYPVCQSISLLLQSQRSCLCILRGFIDRKQCNNDKNLTCKILMFDILFPTDVRRLKKIYEFVKNESNQLQFDQMHAKTIVRFSSKTLKSSDPNYLKFSLQFEQFLSACNLQQLTSFLIILIMCLLYALGLVGS